MINFLVGCCAKNFDFGIAAIRLVLNRENTCFIVGVLYK